MIWKCRQLGVSKSDLNKNVQLYSESLQCLLFYGSAAAADYLNLALLGISQDVHLRLSNLNSF